MITRAGVIGTPKPPDKRMRIPMDVSERFEKQRLPRRSSLSRWASSKAATARSTGGAPPEVIVHRPIRRS
jgi:hypothetical protein